MGLMAGQIYSDEFGEDWYDFGTAEYMEEYLGISVAADLKGQVREEFEEAFR